MPGPLRSAPLRPISGPRDSTRAGQQGAQNNRSEDLKGAHPGRLANHAPPLQSFYNPQTGHRVVFPPHVHDTPLGVGFAIGIGIEQVGGSIPIPTPTSWDEGNPEGGPIPNPDPHFHDSFPDWICVPRVVPRALFPSNSSGPSCLLPPRSIRKSTTRQPRRPAPVPLPPRFQ